MKKVWKFFALFLVFALMLPVLPQASAAKVVYAAQTVTVNGEPVQLDIYNIAGYNYFRLRDLAALLADTVDRFSVSYDEMTQTITAQHFIRPDDVLTPPGADRSRTCVESTQTLTVDGNHVAVEAYNIGGNNFLKLRDLADAFGFTVGYDAEAGVVRIVSEPLGDDAAAEETCFAAIRALYLDGDAEKGISLLADAVDRGSSRAAYHLAESYFYGTHGLSKNLTRAAEYAQTAYAGGNPRGAYLYGYLLWNGQGIFRDESAALDAFVMAANAGNIQAQSFLAEAYYTGTAVRRNDSMAALYARPAADCGDARAQYILGSLYYHGRVMTRNYVRAAELFRTAGEAGVAEAIGALGVCYYEGAGVRWNPYIALEYFMLAAEMGHARSAYNAGLCYAEGVGTDVDMEKAMEFMHMAADAGIAEATEWLGWN